MNNLKSKEIKVGLVTLGALILFIVGITLGRGYSVSVSKQTVLMRFPTSGGIQYTSPVMVNGVKRGEVISVKNDNGSVIISAELDNIDDFKSDVTARILIQEITGGKKIEITPGVSTEKYNPKKVIYGDTPPDMGELFAMLGTAGADAVSLVRKLDSISGSINAMLSDGKLTSQIRNAADNTEELIVNVNKLVKDNYAGLNSALKDIRTITADLKIAIQRNEPIANTLLIKLDTTVTYVNTLIKKVDVTLGNADKLIAEIETTVKDVKTSDGVVGKLIYDKQFAMKLDSAFSELMQLVVQLKNHGINTNIRFGSRP